MKHYLPSLILLVSILISCNEKKKIGPPKFVGDYTTVASMTYSILGKEGSTAPEIEHVKISYVGGDTVVFSSQKTFKEVSVYGIFQDSTFTIVPLEKNGAETTGSGVVSKDNLRMDLVQSGVACATTHLEGPKDGSSDNSKLSQAKNVAKQIIGNVARVERKEISWSTLDKQTKPLQKKLNKLRSEMDSTQIKQLDEYRTALLNQLVDTKMKSQR